MAYSWFILVLGCVLPCLGLGLFCYLFKLYLDYLSELRGPAKTEPEYVREINKKLYMNNVETERDLL